MKIEVTANNLINGKVKVFFPGFIVLNDNEKQNLSVKAEECYRP